MANRITRKPSSKKSAPAFRFPKFGNLKNYISKARKKIEFKKRYKKTVVFAEKKPFTSFFVALGILFAIILLGSTLFRVSAPKIESRTQPKSVEVYRVGGEARINVEGKVEKGGVITIVAQTPGVVSSINTTEGVSVNKGTTLLSLSSNYSGGNAAGLQRQLAGLSYQNTKDTYDTQKEIIAKQREIASTQSDNSENLRQITQVSINDTRDLLNLNHDILDQVKSNIDVLKNSNADPSDILTLQQVQSQIQAGVNQLSSSLRASEYQVNEDKPVVNLENIGREITLKQLDLQEKALKMSLDAAGISLKLAQVQEANMYPAAPFSGVVQRIHVKIGQNVNPGTPLVSFSCSVGDVIVDAKVSKEIAQKISKITPSTISVNGKRIESVPYYVSTEATDGQLYSVLFTIDEKYRSLFTDESYVAVNLPIGQKIESPVPFIPIDGVFQTQEESYVFVVANGKAKSKKIKLGEVTGGYVNVIEGLNRNDQIILTRTVIDGDEVKVQN